ncbi:MAG TPA: plastocyanin/azurin family copper-binding protein [Candidatus Limnocylindria bacterium]
MKALRFVAGLTLFLAVGCASAAGSSPSTAATTDHVDLPRSYLFSPAAINVKAGTTVTWTNDDQFTHSVRLVATGEVLGILKPGETLTHTFTAPGVYQYDCSFHPQNMKGTVTVN